MVCPPWLKKWGGGHVPPPPSPTRLRPWVGGCRGGGGWGLSIFRCGSWRPNTLIYHCVYHWVCVETFHKHDASVKVWGKWGGGCSSRIHHCSPQYSAWRPPNQSTSHFSGWDVCVTLHSCCFPCCAKRQRKTHLFGAWAHACMCVCALLCV